ncbi:hypothetical protein [Pararhodobacter sp.]|uniref:hypothetical protein n=1 Tax=Pararhodobacter sp. TaxID=2127056 RepID=UPI002AFFDB67|nr:hypothetical protein [Pararhodobacter sp.]
MRMKLPILSLALLVTLALPAQAACFAEYRASRQNPVQLAYGVAQIPGNSCSAQAASQYLQSRLSSSGWTLQNIVSTVTSNSAPANSGYTGGHYLSY